MAPYNSIKIIYNHSQWHLTYDCLKYKGLFTNFLPPSGTYTVIPTGIGSINYWFESPRKIKSQLYVYVAIILDLKVQGRKKKQTYVLLISINSWLESSSKKKIK